MSSEAASILQPLPSTGALQCWVGRTGTFIVLDTMLERMKEEDTLNVYDYVKQLREQRVLMVQILVRILYNNLHSYTLLQQNLIPLLGPIHIHS